jgi:hypothetical protein
MGNNNNISQLLKLLKDPHNFDKPIQRRKCKNTPGLIFSSYNNWHILLMLPAMLRLQHLIRIQ